MENILENIDKIMKPYFDKKEESENLSKEPQKMKDNLNSNLENINKEKYSYKIQLEEAQKSLNNDIEELKQKRSLERKRLELSLKYLRDTKEQEIEDYIKEFYPSNPNYSSHYVQMAKMDLEKSNENKEQEIIREIEAFDKKTEEEIAFMNDVRSTNALEEYYKNLSNLNEQEKVTMSELDVLNKKPSYDRVYRKELEEEADKVIKNLFIEKEKLKYELKKEKINYDSILLNKYEYNDQHQVINGPEWRKLCDESFEKIRNLEKALNKVDKYIEEIHEFREKSTLQVLTQWEQAEYDRRNKIQTNETFGIEKISENNEPLTIIELKESTNSDLLLPSEEVEIEKTIDIDSILPTEETEAEETIDFDSILPFEEVEVEQTINLDSILPFEEVEVGETINLDSVLPSEEFEKEEKSLENKYSPINQDLIEVDDNIKYSSSYDEEKYLVDSYSDLVKMVYDDVMSSIDFISSVRLNPSKKELKENEYYFSTKADDFSDYLVEGTVNLDDDFDPIQLPSGEYINVKNLEMALDNYYLKNKGKTFSVKSENINLKMTKNTLNKCKDELKNCSTIKLLTENKLSSIDLTRVYGKTKTNNIMEYSRLREIGSLHSDIKDGTFVSKREMLCSLQNLFTEKKSEWIKKSLENFIQKTDSNENSTKEQFQKIK